MSASALGVDALKVNIFANAGAAMKSVQSAISMVSDSVLI